MRDEAEDAAVEVEMGTADALLLSACARTFCIPPDRIPRRALDAAPSMHENRSVDITTLLLAEDEERRSLERLLHDGAQQRLTAIAMSLQLTTGSLVDDPGAAAARIADVRAELGEAIDELRDLARRIHPQLLDTLGHTVALKAVARVEGEMPEPLPPEVAVTAYRLCATGGSAVVRASDGALRVEIVGDAPSVERLRPRVEALGGTLLLDLGRITATLPLPL